MEENHGGRSRHYIAQFVMGKAWWQEQKNPMILQIHSGSRDTKLMFTLAFPSGLFHDSRPENGVAYI